MKIVNIVCRAAVTVTLLLGEIDKRLDKDIRVRPDY